MDIIQIKTIGEVALPRTIDSSVGYLYDIPTDEMGIPCIPTCTLLEDIGNQFPRVILGFAHPDGFMSLVRNAAVLMENIPNCFPMIRSYFLNERFLPEKMCSIRSLKAGQTLYSHVFFEEKDREKIKKALEQITHIGVSYGPVTGEVSVKLISHRSRNENKPNLSAKCSYASLDISYFLQTPACFYDPFSDGLSTASYIPGSDIRAELIERMKRESINWDEILCSNAYIAMNGQRLLPTPICVSAVKMDKEQLRYRLSPGKDPKIIEQDRELCETYTSECGCHKICYAAPEIKHIISKDGIKYDALSSGQLFIGTIYGSNADIRAIAAYLSRNPVTNLGTLRKEGFGEVSRAICHVNEKDISEECLHRSFDVCCVSNVLLLNEKGMPTCQAEDLLKEIEYSLGVSGRLRIVGKYTSVYRDFSQNRQWNEDRGVVKCFEKGSILRLEVVGDPIDIFPIKHLFIGERTQEGYGEICVWPARGEYYRLGEKVSLHRYNTSFREKTRNMILGAHMTNAVITAILKDKVQALVAIDQNDYAAGYEPEDIIPTELLSMFRDQYNPLLTTQEVSLWYSEMLKGGQDYEENS